MSRSAVRGAVTDYLAANWTLSELVYQNTTTEPPVASDGVLRPWVYVEVSYNSTDQWSIGETDRTENRWREDGQVFFHVFTPAGAGLSVADQHADARRCRRCRSQQPPGRQCNCRRRCRASSPRSLWQ